MDAFSLLRVAAAVAVGFLVGSIPFALVVGKLFWKVDVREHGSGNPGATNTLRTLGWRAAIPVAALDIAKGSLAVLLAAMIVPKGLEVGPLYHQGAVVLAGVAAVLGHAFSPFLDFKGGKGIATIAGALAVLTPTLLLIAVGIWLFVVIVTRYVSLASIVAALSAPILGWIFRPDNPFLIPLLIVGPALIIWLHRANAKRLLSGTEKQISFGRPASSGGGKERS